MEHTITIKLPEELTQQGRTDEELLCGVLNANSEQIGYLIQDYYPREKVRSVSFDQKEIRKASEDFTAKATYTLEQFNVCAAIDTLERSSMLMKVSMSKSGEDLIVAGERVFD
jgi:hypothetical protein